MITESTNRSGDGFTAVHGCGSSPPSGGLGMPKVVAYLTIALCAAALVLRWRSSTQLGSVDSSADTNTDATGAGLSVAICILTRRNGWEQRHLVRQTWLQDVPEGGRVAHVFVIGEDTSFTKEENARLMHEVEVFGDILLAPAEESYATLAQKTKHCLYWATSNHDFDILIKTDDDSVLFLSRLMERWLADVRRTDYIYFGKQHLPTQVANPANFLLNEFVSTDKYFEFAYRGMYWPEFMQGGMYGFSRALAESMVKTPFWTYTSEDATVGVWMSALRPDVKYLEAGHLLYQKDDYLNAQPDKVLVTFQTDRLRLASMWCEYEESGQLSTASILMSDKQHALACLGRYECSKRAPRSRPLAGKPAVRADIMASLAREWPITAPNLAKTGAWWQNMEKAFRKRGVFIIGDSPSLNQQPLYLIKGKHVLATDSFFQRAEQFGSWSPTMYACVDPRVCVGSAAEINKFVRPLFASFFAFAGGAGSGVQYWQQLRQRVNVHWFVMDPERHGMQVAFQPDGQSMNNFHVASHGSVVAMTMEILAYLGFATIYIMAAEDDIKGSALFPAAKFVGQRYGTKVVHVYSDKPAGLPRRNVIKQEDIKTLTWRMNKGLADVNANWDVDLFLQTLPALGELKIVPNATTIPEVFPRAKRCRSYYDLDRYDRAALCPTEVSRKYFESFRATHVPHGPIRGYFLWLRR